MLTINTNEPVAIDGSDPSIHPYERCVIATSLDRYSWYCVRVSIPSSQVESLMTSPEVEQGRMGRYCLEHFAALYTNTGVGCHTYWLLPAKS